MRVGNRRTAPGVKGGKVQRKNNWTESPNYWNTPQQFPMIDRQRPGKGYRHLLKQRDIHDFISILPDWDELSTGLDAIVLAPGERGIYGWQQAGVVALCAWDENLWVNTGLGHPYSLADLDTFRRLSVALEMRSDYAVCKCTEAQGKAFQLLRVFLHELGHHHDRMTTKSQFQASRGEPYAETYALRYERVVWERYIEVFELD